MADPFVLLPENRTAFEAVASAFARSTSSKRAGQNKVGQPVTICGPSGSGKSALIKHLLAEANAKSKQRNREPLFRSGIDWADEYRRADRDGATADWLRKQNQHSVVVLDGIDPLARRESVSEQLTSIIDTVVESGGRVVLTISSMPGQQRGFSRRLADRIRGGTLLSLEPLTLASREKLLEHFASRRQMPVEASALKRLATVTGTTAGEVFRTVQELEKLSIQRRSGVNPAVVGEFIRRIEGEPPSIPQIARAVAKEFSARVSDLRAAGRSQSIVVPRQTAMFLAREVAGEQYQVIGNYFGRRNHSTVVHSVRKVERMLDDSPEFASRVVQIRSALGLPG